MSKTTVLQNHIAFKRTSVHSQAKIKDIERYLNSFINSTSKPLSKFTEQDIVKFLNSLDYGIRTTNDVKAHIKVFVKWNYPDWSLKFRNLDKICRQQTPPKAYTPDQMISYEDFEKIIKAETDLQWKTYFLTLFYGGFRPSEACRLKWSEVFFEDEGVIIKLRTTKTTKDFMKSLPKEAEHKLKELKSNSISDYVFPSPYSIDKCIGARSVCARLKKVSKRALGISVVPYQLRHSIATILYGDDTKKDDDVAQQLGHTKNMRDVYKNLNTEQIKTKARSLWGKPLTKQEKDELKELREKIKNIEEKLSWFDEDVGVEAISLGRTNKGKHIIITEEK